MKEVRFENGEGLELVGNLWESESNRGIVMSHGFTGDKHEWGSFDKVAKKVNEADFNVLTFDFSGCGESDKTSLTAEKEVEDLKAAIKYLKDEGVGTLGLFGHSLGGYVSLRNDSMADAMVLTAPVTGSIDLASNHFWNLFINLFGKLPSWNYLKNKRQLMWIDSKIVEEMRSVNREELLSGVECPVLIINGGEDEVIPVEESRKASELLNQSKMEVIEGLSHGYEGHTDQVADSSIEWFNENL